MSKSKYTLGPWSVSSLTRIESKDCGLIASVRGDLSEQSTHSNARLIAAAPGLLAYVECSAAWDCALMDTSFDPRPTLRSHGWNEQENFGLFLSRIRRDALNKAVGHYLGREASAA